jgi:hypothetical protein
MDQGERMHVIVPLLIFGFLLYCVLDVVLTSEDEIRNLPKLVWLVLVLLIPIIGGVAWLVAGRPATHGGAPGGARTATGFGPGRHPSGHGSPAPGGGRPGPSRRPSAPRGPDDDPEFIKQLERRLRRPGEGPPAA